MASPSSGGRTTVATSSQGYRFSKYPLNRQRGARIHFRWSHLLVIHCFVGLQVTRCGDTKGPHVNSFDFKHDRAGSDMKLDREN